MRIFGTEWFTICFSGLIKGPLAYIFAGVLVSTVYPDLNLNGDYLETDHDYKKIRSFYVIQLVVIISIVLLSPLNYLVVKFTVANEETPQATHDINKVTADSYKKYQNVGSEIDGKKMNVIQYMDENLTKPFFIRSYHSRKKCLGVLKHAFELTSQIYNHSGHHEEHNDHEEHDAHHELSHSPHKSKELESDHSPRKSEIDSYQERMTSDLDQSTLVL